MKKAKGSKYFTPETTLVANPERQFDACNDPAYHYFALHLYQPDHTFVMRTNSMEDKDAWVSFLTKALENFQASVIGQDPNIGRWTERVEGVTMAVRHLREFRADAMKELVVLRSEQIALDRELRDLEREDADIKMETANAATQLDAAKHESDRLATELMWAEENLEALRTQSASALDHATTESMDMKNCMLNAQVRFTASEKKINQIEEELKVAMKEKADMQEKAKRIFEKWRRSEERTPKEGTERVKKIEGLLFESKTLPLAPGKKTHLWYA